MPLRRQEIRAKKNVTLGETRNWIAFDDFNGPPLHPEEASAQITGVIDNVEALEFEEFNRLQLLEEADGELFAALRDGEVRSHGRFSDQLADNSVANNWRERTYTGHSNTRVEIPADFWWLEGVDWNGNRAKNPNGEFGDIILNREEVLATWPLEETEFEKEPVSSGEKSEGRSGQKRGRKQLYSEKDFLGLCVLDAVADGLPETQNAFVERMAQLLAIMWGEKRVPGDTWLKEKISRIYDLRKEYDDRRQKLESE